MQKLVQIQDDIRESRHREFGTSENSASDLPQLPIETIASLETLELWLLEDKHKQDLVINYFKFVIFKSNFHVQSVILVNVYCMFVDRNIISGQLVVQIREKLLEEFWLAHLDRN